MTSCTIVKLVYNQFSDEDEFILFDKTKTTITDSTVLPKDYKLSVETTTKNIDTAYQYCIIDSLHAQITE